MRIRILYTDNSQQTVPDVSDVSPCVGGVMRIRCRDGRTIDLSAYAFVMVVHHPDADDGHDVDGTERRA